MATTPPSSRNRTVQYNPNSRLVSRVIVSSSSSSQEHDSRRGVETTPSRPTPSRGLGRASWVRIESAPKQYLKLIHERVASTSNHETRPMNRAEALAIAHAEIRAAVEELDYDSWMYEDITG